MKLIVIVSILAYPLIAVSNAIAEISETRYRRGQIKIKRCPVGRGEACPPGECGCLAERARP